MYNPVNTVYIFIGWNDVCLPPPGESAIHILDYIPEENVHTRFLHETVNIGEHRMRETVKPTTKNHTQIKEAKAFISISIIIGHKKDSF